MAQSGLDLFLLMLATILISVALILTFILWIMLTLIKSVLMLNCHLLSAGQKVVERISIYLSKGTYLHRICGTNLVSYLLAWATEARKYFQSKSSYWLNEEMWVTRLISLISTQSARLVQQSRKTVKTLRLKSSSTSQKKEP